MEKRTHQAVGGALVANPIAMTALFVSERLRTEKAADGSNPRPGCWAASGDVHDRRRTNTRVRPAGRLPGAGAIESATVALLAAVVHRTYVLGISLR